MNTLLNTIYNLLSYVSEDRLSELPIKLRQPISDLMTLLEEYLD